MDYIKRVAGIFSRSKARVANNLGRISMPMGDEARRLFRNPKMELMDAYYEGRQYDHLPDFDQQIGADGVFIPLRHRQPRIRYPFAKVFAERVTAKLLGNEVFPKFQVPESPDDEAFFQAVIKSAKLRSRLLEPTRRMLAGGSVFVRFYIAGGQYKVEHYLGKYCYPQFDESGELESIEIKYVFDDEQDLDANKIPKKKWYKLQLDKVSEVLFDNPEYKEKQDPVFTEVARVDHGLGFVQGEWFRTMEIKDKPDGPSVIEDCLDFVDELNYSLSQSSQAVSYNQDPQLIFKKMDEDDLKDLIRSSAKAWNLGRDGEAAFLESNLSGVQRAMEFRDKIRLNLQDIARVVLLDPEKIVGSAQSGKALEVLHGPMVELVNELRPVIEHSLRNLVMKIAVATLLSSRQGLLVPINIPPTYTPMNLEPNIVWPPVFQQTIQDIQQKVTMVLSATNASLISRETGTRFLAPDFNVENVEEEIQKIASQPVINPFGMF